MADVTGLVITKEFTYRGDTTETWSNKYWLTGAPPGDVATWKALADLLIGHEVSCYSSSSRVVAAYGYSSNDPHAQSAWSYDYAAAGATVPGTLIATVNAAHFAGDQAGIVEWKTSRKNTRGKWVYLRKYFHDGFVNPASRDDLDVDTLDAYDAFGHLLVSGQLDNRTIRSQKQDESIQVVVTPHYVTTRTLKRRGKRP